MKKRKELLIGLFVCLSVGVLYWGIEFLKGENVFSNRQLFYAVYEEIDGLNRGSPVTVNGFKVGQVSDIHLSEEHANLVVSITIKEKIPFVSSNAVLEIYDSDLLGTKALELKLINGDNKALNGDTLRGSIASGLTSEVSAQFGSVKVSLDQLIISFDQVLKEVTTLSNTANRILLSNEKRLTNSIENIDSISNLITSNTRNLDNTLLNISNVSDSLAAVEFLTISNNMLEVSQKLDLLLTGINNSEGSMGKLIYQDSLYNDLSNAINNLDGLLIDIKQNPKNYINISVFGGGSK